MSAVEKPEPETPTVVPIAADEVPNVMVGEVPATIVKLVNAESPPGLPTAVIVYEPVLAVATVNLPVNVPLETEQVKELTGAPEIEHEESLGKKFDPDTSTVAPADPEVGLSVIDGGCVETTKLADAVSPLGSPVAVIV